MKTVRVNHWAKALHPTNRRYPILSPGFKKIGIDLHTAPPPPPPLRGKFSHDNTHDSLFCHKLSPVEQGPRTTSFGPGPQKHCHPPSWQPPTETLAGKAQRNLDWSGVPENFLLSARTLRPLSMPPKEPSGDETGGNHFVVLRRNMVSLVSKRYNRNPPCLTRSVGDGWFLTKGGDEKKMKYHNHIKICRKFQIRTTQPFCRTVIGGPSWNAESRL